MWSECHHALLYVTDGFHRARGLDPSGEVQRSHTGGVGGFEVPLLHVRDCQGGMRQCPAPRPVLYAGVGDRLACVRFGFVRLSEITKGVCPLAAYVRLIDEPRPFRLSVGLDDGEGALGSVDGMRDAGPITDDCQRPRFECPQVSEAGGRVDFRQTLATSLGESSAFVRMPQQRRLIGSAQ